MPELPEVEREVRQLRPAMEGARFERVVIRRRRLRTLLPLRFASRLEGTTVRALRRRGKYLVADLSSERWAAVPPRPACSMAISFLYSASRLNTPEKPQERALVDGCNWKSW